MLPPELEGAVADYVAVLDREAPGAIAAVYLVGGLGLDDFSHRHSNVDLVVVSEALLGDAQIESARKAEKGMTRNGRGAAVWYTTWDELDTEPDADEAGCGPRGGGLDTPLTRSMLHHDAVALTGPDWPVVAADEDTLRAWCRRELQALASEGHGSMVMRYVVSPLVLQAARLAQTAVTGRVYSKTEAGQLAGELVPKHFRRILNDSVGFRNGAHASMYWGPFERKYDAREVIKHFAKV